MKHKITITMEGGLIQDISGIPESVVIEVMDFDVEGCEPESLKENEHGEKFTLTEW